MRGCRSSGTMGRRSRRHEPWRGRRGGPGPGRSGPRVGKAPPRSRPDPRGVGGPVRALRGLRELRGRRGRRAGSPEPGGRMRRLRLRRVLYSRPRSRPSGGAVASRRTAAVPARVDPRPPVAPSNRHLTLRPDADLKRVAAGSPIYRDDRHTCESLSPVFFK